MGIQSATTAALSGITAATAKINAVALNLANSQTPAYQAQAITLASQLGNGVQVVSRAADPSSAVTDEERPLPLLTLEGEGLFILQRSEEERVYSRDGRFSLDGNGYLVNSLGDRLLGQAVNEQGILDRSQLAPLQVRLGSTVETPNGATAKLIGYSVQRSGRLVGRYSDGVQRTLGQLRIARFPNSPTTMQATSHLYRRQRTALPLETDAGTNGAASVAGGTNELSSIDAGEQLIQLSLARMHFRLNLATLETANSLLHELMRVGQRRL